MYYKILMDDRDTERVLNALLHSIQSHVRGGQPEKAARIEDTRSRVADQWREQRDRTK